MSLHNDPIYKTAARLVDLEAVHVYCFKSETFVLSLNIRYVASFTLTLANSR